MTQSDRLQSASQLRQEALVLDYDPHDWSGHLFDLRGSMVREILGRLTVCVAWSALVVLIYQLPFMKWIAMPSTVHSLVGVALGLLLVFRTNSSYDRFWEGRKLWGGITNECRNLARSASILLEKDPPRLRTVIHWAMVLPYAIMARLRNVPDLGPTVAKLPQRDVRDVLATRHLALAVARRITQTLADARDTGVITSYEMISIDHNVQQLIDYCGACERIHGTPLPYPYMVHLRRALLLYCFTLPFALVREFGWITIFDTVMVTYIFFGIEEIGVEIEDPFGHDDNDLPLADFCRNIAHVLEELLTPDPEAVDAEPAASREPGTAALPAIPLE